MFTSNNTSQEEFLFASQDGGCILNLDDITLIPKVPEFPELICFRYNPGPRRTGIVYLRIMYAIPSYYGRNSRASRRKC